MGAGGQGHVSAACVEENFENKCQKLIVFWIKLS